MKGTIPQWIGAIALVVIAYLVFSTRQLGFSDGWVTAIATTALAVAAIIGLAGVMVPLRQEAARRRQVHLETLTAEVLDPLKSELESHYLGPVSRQDYLFDWGPSPGITLAKLGPKYMFVLTGGPTDNSLFEKRYRDIKLNHFPAVIGHIENFKLEFDAFRNSALAWVKKLEQELQKGSGLAELTFSQPGVPSCYHGFLAVYIFNRIFLDRPVYLFDILPDSSNPQAPWKLKSTASGHEPAFGTKVQMENLNKFVEPLVVRERSVPLIAEADTLHRRLKKALGELADIQTKGKLEGDCDATR